MSRTATTYLVDGELLAQIEYVRRTLRLAKQTERINSQGLADQSPRLERELVELSTRAAEEAQRFVMKSLPGAVFDDIARQHPLSDQQLQRYREQAKVVPWTELEEYNPDTMGVHLVAACLIEPEWSEEETFAFWATLSKGEQNQLWNTALGVNLKEASLPNLPAATGTISGGGEPWTSPANGAYPSVSS